MHNDFVSVTSRMDTLSAELGNLRALVTEHVPTGPQKDPRIDVHHGAIVDILPKLKTLAESHTALVQRVTSISALLEQIVDQQGELSDLIFELRQPQPRLGLFTRARYWLADRLILLARKLDP